MAMDKFEAENRRMRAALEEIIRTNQPCAIDDCIRGEDGRIRPDPTKTRDGPYAKIARAALSASSTGQGSDLPATGSFHG